MQSIPRTVEFSTHYNVLPSQGVNTFPTSRFVPKETTVSSISLTSPPPTCSFVEDFNEAMPASLPISRVAQSAAEKAREKRLRADPMAVVLGPLYVDCKICSARIKLSSKSLYDACHWQTHRSRCIKRNNVTLPKSSPKTSTLDSLSVPVPLSLSKNHKSKTLARLPALHSPPGILSSYTRHPTTKLTAHVVFEEYLLRLHGKRYYPLTTSTEWKDWSWSQLLHPHITSFPEPEPPRDDEGYDANRLYGSVPPAVS